VNRMFYIPTSLKVGIARQILGNCKSHLRSYANWALLCIIASETGYFATTISDIESRVIVVRKVCFILGHYTRKLLGVFI
jgi:hypothetical protein